VRLARHAARERQREAGLAELPAPPPNDLVGGGGLSAVGLHGHLALGVVPPWGSWPDDGLVPAARRFLTCCTHARAPAATVDDVRQTAQVERVAPESTSGQRTSPQLPSSVSALSLLQRQIGNRAFSALLADAGPRVASGRVLARKTKLKGSSGAWVVEGRPDGWVRADALTQSLIREWNADPDNWHRLLLPKTNFTLEKLDRCHKKSWEKIRDKILVPFLNDPSRLNAEDGFKKRVDKLWALKATDPYRVEFADVYHATFVVAKQISLGLGWGKLDPADVETLAKHLNSARSNLRLADHNVNIKIQGKHDAPVRFTGNVAPSGNPEFRFTPRVKEILGDDTPDYRWTEDESRFASSTQGSWLDPADATPGTQKYFL
jgi:hypothetical protein